MTDAVLAPRRRRWPIYAPLILILLLAAGWTAGWFYAAHRAEGAFAIWIERQAKAGRTFACADRAIGGYPFRIEVRCSDPAVTLPSESGPIAIKARNLLAVAQIYQPNLVIAEISGPMTVTLGPDSYIADWSLLQVSLRGRPSLPQRLSLVIDGSKLDRTTAAGPEPVVRAQKLELHARRNPDADASNPVFDLTARAVAAMVPAIPNLAERPIAADASAVLRGIKDFAPRPMPQRLREWQAAGGRLELTNARLAQGEALAVVKGEVGLTAQGQLDGTLNLTLAGLDQVANLILGQSDRGRAQRGLVVGLTLLGRTELEGKRAMAVPLRFKDGQVFFGPIPVGRTEPLF